MLPHEFQDLLEKFSRGACSPEEEQLIMDWYHNIGHSESTQLDVEEKGRVEQRLWAGLRPDPQPKRRWLPLLTRAAAITFPLLAVAFFYFNQQVITGYILPGRAEALPSTPSEEHFRNSGTTAQRLALPDGSEVTLHPSSEIFLSPDFGESTRELRLTGEAFFDVKRDPHKPFVVYSNEVTTRVLGTSFNIKAYARDKEITVAVRTGRVSVYTGKDRSRGVNDIRRDDREVILTPNQQMVYRREKAEVLKQLVEEPEIILPETDLFHMQFENAEVASIFEVLEENYGISIRFDKDKLSQCRLTTTMSDEGLYERIEIICKAIGASYSIDDDAAIIIQSDGC